MLGELNTPVALSVWDKILLIKSKRVHALRDKIQKLVKPECGTLLTPLTRANILNICNINFENNFFFVKLKLVQFVRACILPILLPPLMETSKLETQFSG